MSLIAAISECKGAYRNQAYTLAEHLPPEEAEGGRQSPG